MQVNQIQNNIYSASFGTSIGANIQEKILLCKSKNRFSAVNDKNLLKIEDDGLPAVLEIVNKFKLKKIINKRNIPHTKTLDLIVKGKGYTIDKLENVFTGNHNDSILCFNCLNFAKLFSEEYNLAEKIKMTYKSIIENK